jgi:hypothetical protein
LDRFRAPLQCQLFRVGHGIRWVAYRQNQGIRNGFADFRHDLIEDGRVRLEQAKSSEWIAAIRRTPGLLIHSRGNNHQSRTGQLRIVAVSHVNAS